MRHKNKGMPNGWVLRVLRDYRMMNQRELARAAGMENTTVWTIEQGWHSPHLATLKKLASALEVDVRVLRMLRRRDEVDEQTARQLIADVDAEISPIADEAAG